MPIRTMRTAAGRAALGALPNATMPAGKPRTPAPTMPLTRLKMSSGTVAVPPLVDDGSAAAASADSQSEVEWVVDVVVGIGI